MIAFLGTGLLGSNFIRALLAKGESVQAWNRTAEKARALEAFGARVFDNAAAAVKDVQRIHVIMSDDAAVENVLEQASAGIMPGAIIIDHTTTSVEGAVKRTERWQQKGIIYLHAPVFMGPSNALEGSGFMLISGDQQLVQKVSPWLAGMTGKLLNFGERTGKAASIKLMGNLFLFTLTSGLSEMLALGKAMDIPHSDIRMLFDNWNPGAAARLQRILTAPYDDPSWELQMARKDARLMMEEAARGHQDLALVPMIAGEMDKWLEKGYAHKDWTVITSENL